MVDDKKKKKRSKKGKVEIEEVGSVPDEEKTVDHSQSAVDPDSNDPDANDPDSNDPDSNDPDSNDPDSNDPDSNEGGGSGEAAAAAAGGADEGVPAAEPAEVEADEPIANKEMSKDEVDEEKERHRIYKVVINEEEQYSIWAHELEIPAGWRFEGVYGRKEEVLAHIEKVWTDMRPLSLRRAMEEWPEARQFKGISPEGQKMLDEWKKKEDEWDGVDQFRKPRPPNALVKKLMRKQPIVVIRYRDRDTDKPDIKLFKRAIELGLILVKFPNTKGGTELGFNVRNDEGHLDPKNIKYKDGGKVVEVSGRLKLDYTPVRGYATINLETFEGEGYLVPINDFSIKLRY